jgi:hypothetical protein
MGDMVVRIGDRLPLTRPVIHAVRRLASSSPGTSSALRLCFPGRGDTLPFILPILMEGHNVLWGDTAAIATISAMPVTVALSFSKISCAGFRSAGCAMNTHC